MIPKFPWGNAMMVTFAMTGKVGRVGTPSIPLAHITFSQPAPHADRAVLWTVRTESRVLKSRVCWKWPLGGHQQVHILSDGCPWAPRGCAFLSIPQARVSLRAPGTCSVSKAWPAVPVVREATCTACLRAASRILQ